MWLIFLFLFSFLCADIIPEKLLICGVCKNIEASIENTIYSIEKLGSYFQDYRVIIYENNSKDRTKELMRDWGKRNDKLIFLSENLKNSQYKKESPMKLKNRTEVMARARNKVLSKAMDSCFDDYKYVVWADLDFLEPWDVEGLKRIVLHPEEEWDGVFAYGAYDLFAMRSETCPIGFELLGNVYWDKLKEIEKEFVFQDCSWQSVYSAFGGLAIYKREALKGVRYSGLVTRDMEKVIDSALKKARMKKDVCLLSEYEHLLKTSKILQVQKEVVKHRDKYPETLGVKLFNQFGIGQVVWFSCTGKNSLPWTCEHIPLHASMILKGRDRLFVDPKLRSNHPERK